MYTAKARIQKIFFFIANSGDYVRSREIAQFTGLSERTVKSDMEELKAYAEKNGCSLKAVRGKGYKLTVVDEAIFQKAKMQLDIRYPDSDFFKKEDASRTNDIIRYLIIQNSFVKLDDLAAVLRTSRSAMKYELKQVRAYLDTFNLTLETRPGYGVKVAGSELSKRMCMLEMYEFHYHGAVSAINNPDFTAFFQADDQERVDIRHSFLVTLRASQLRLIDQISQRLARYFILLRNRRKSGHFVDVPDEVKGDLKRYGEYGVAQEIFLGLQRFSGFAIDENEVYALTLMLLIWTDLLDSDDMKGRYKHIYKEAETIMNMAMDYFRRQWRIDLYAIEGCHNVLMTAFIPLAFSIKYASIIRYNVSGIAVSENVIRTSPLCAAFAMTVYHRLKDFLNHSISDWYLNLLAVRFYALVDKVGYRYKPPRIIITSRNGIQAAGLLRDKLIKCFGERAFEAVEINTYYGIRAMDHTQYDYVILNHPSYGYNYSIPYICVDQIPDKQEMESIYNNIILSAYNFDSLLQSFAFNANYVYDDFDYESRDSFIKLLAFKYGKDYESTLRLCDLISQKPNMYIYGATAVLILNSDYTEGNCFSVFKFRRLSKWENKDVKYFVFISVQFEDLYQIRFLEQLTHELIYYQGNIEKALREKNAEALVYLVKSSMAKMGL